MKIITAFFVLILVAGCEDRFRYNCQDPKHHNSPSCNPPVCEASGTCTKYLIGEPNEE